MTDSSSVEVKDSVPAEKKGKRRKAKEGKSPKDENKSLSVDTGSEKDNNPENHEEDKQPTSGSPKEKKADVGKVVAASTGEHPLETTWTLYFDKKLPPSRQKNADFKHYQSNLQTLGTFGSLEGFWKHYAYLQNPNDIPKDHDLFLFRHHFIPAWESFPNGGAWIVKVRKKNGIISRLWEELVFACISEAFEEPDLVGAVLSCRMREDIVSVWNRDNSENAERRFKIGEKLKDILNLDESTQIAYKPFQSAIKDGSSYRNARQYVYAASSV